jgi:hypothetical protein
MANTTVHVMSDIDAMDDDELAAFIATDYAALQRYATKLLASMDPRRCCCANDESSSRSAK